MNDAREERSTVHDAFKPEDLVLLRDLAAAVVIAGEDGRCRLLDLAELIAERADGGTPPFLYKDVILVLKVAAWANWPTHVINDFSWRVSVHSALWREA